MTRALQLPVTVAPQKHASADDALSIVDASGSEVVTIILHGTAQDPDDGVYPHVETAARLLADAINAAGKA